MEIEGLDDWTVLGAFISIEGDEIRKVTSYL